MENLNIHPYYDDFDPKKNFKQILYKPGQPLQARELTQQQSILRYQIENIAQSLYKDGQIISGCTITINSSLTAVKIGPGEVYVEGYIVKFENSTILSITGSGSEIIGLVKIQQIITDADDPTLRDPAQGFDAYNKPGADRLKVTWQWAVLSSESLDVDLDANQVVVRQISVFTIIDGQIPTQKKISDAEVEKIFDAIAKRDYLASGNYVLEGLKLKLIDHPHLKNDMKQLIVTAGTARIRGYDITISNNLVLSIPVSRSVDTVYDEPWGEFVPFDPKTRTGGVYRLGERPVSKVYDVVATVLAVDGYGSRPAVVRGSISGGSDELSEQSVVSIIAVNQGGTWDPITETFVGGTTYPPSSYVKDGNDISWAPSGPEPSPGSTYQVAYRYRKHLKKEIVKIAYQENEPKVHGGETPIQYPFRCEMNFHVGGVFLCRDGRLGGGPPRPDDPSKYTLGVDFVVDDITGEIDWYEYDVQILTLTRGYPDSHDEFSALIRQGWMMYKVLGVATNDGIWDPSTQQFESATFVYTEGTDYLVFTGIAEIDWSPPGNEVQQSHRYKVAVKIRRYRTSNHPVVGDTYYLSYSYWKVVDPGDYLSRDSFYRVWVAHNHSGNVKQHYGLDAENVINFWRSTSYRENIGNINKPSPGTMVEVTYDYYLAQYCLVEFHQTEYVRLHYSEASKRPVEPVFDSQDKSLILGKIYLPPDSLNMVVTEFEVGTLKMLDLRDLRSRVVRTEQNLATTLLDLDARNLPVSNKKGISTSSFHNSDRIDLGWPGVAFSIDPDYEELSLPHEDSFYNLVVDPVTTKAPKIYKQITSLSPIGTSVIEQLSYTGDESIAPDAIAIQDFIGESQNLYIILDPPGDTHIIPRPPMEFLSRSDAEAWAASDVARLSDPGPFFASGLRGDAASNTQVTLWSTSYIRDIAGSVRQLTINFTIPGGLIPPSRAQVDYHMYFGGVRVSVTPTAGTPAGSTPGSFRARESDRGASGTFVIPPGIPEGKIEVKAVSTPIMINGREWKSQATAVFFASVQEQVTLQYDTCRCNCVVRRTATLAGTCRCGTSPLAQTIEPIGKIRILRSVSIDFTKVHPIYGTYLVVLKTVNGVPTSAGIASGTVAKAYLSAGQMSGGGMKEYVFDDPVVLNDETYAFMVTGEDEWNADAINEVAAGRDIRCKIGTLGAVDKNTGLVVGAQPFPKGVLFKSLTGVTWEADMKSDLVFRATFDTYQPQVFQIVYLKQQSVGSASAFICNWNSYAPPGTKILYEYSTDKTPWTEFSPFILTRLSQEASTITFRAKLMTMDPDVSPIVENTASLYVQAFGKPMKVVTRQVFLDSSEVANTLDIWIDSFLPSGNSQALRVTFDNGESWIDLDNPVDGRPNGNLIEVTLLDENTDKVRVRYHWKVVLDQGRTFSAYRVEIQCVPSNVSSAMKRPRFSNFITIASRS